MKNTITTITKAAELLNVTDEMLGTMTDRDIAEMLQTRYGKRHFSMFGSDYCVQCSPKEVTLDDKRTVKYTWLELVKAARLVAGERGALQAVKAAELTRLNEVEARIHAHIQSAYGSMLQVGRDLIDAKELVPHGEWENWVLKNAHMSVRQAQNLMKAARDVAPGSRLEALPISKIQEILALPEPEREAMAERAQSEDMTVKQLREAIANERKRSDAMIEKYNEANNRRTALQREMERQQQAFSERQRESRQNIDALKLQLEEARKAPKGISPEAQARIDALQAELENAEAMAERQAELRQDAQRELTEMKSRAARGDVSEREDLTVDALVTSVRTFVSCVGYVPHSSRLKTLCGEERQLVAAHVDMVAKWVEDVREGLGTGEVYVIEEA